MSKSRLVFQLVPSGIEPLAGFSIVVTDPSVEVHSPTRPVRPQQSSILCVRDLAFPTSVMSVSIVFCSATVNEGHKVGRVAWPYLPGGIMEMTVNCGDHLSNSLDTITVGPAGARPDIKHTWLTNARGDGPEPHHHLHLNYTKHLWGSNCIFTVEFVHRYINFFTRPEPGAIIRSWRRL